MSVFKTVAVAALVAIIALAWRKHREQIPQHNWADRPQSINGFISFPPSEFIDTGKVVIFAPLNCPQEVGQRADSLTNELAANRIPNARISHISFTFDSSDRSSLERVDTVLQGDQPVVFVNGRAKGNPKTVDVINEYRASKTPRE